MSDTSTATCETRDARETGPRVDVVDYNPAIGHELRGDPVRGLATYYRLRCIALETTLAALRAELDRTERHAQRIRDRYEDLLQQRECADEPVFSR